MLFVSSISTKLGKIQKKREKGKIDFFWRKKLPCHQLRNQGKIPSGKAHSEPLRAWDVNHLGTRQSGPMVMLPAKGLMSRFLA